MNNVNVAILLASYNGEKYIEEQIKSILSQSYPFWHLYIRDDGSTDNTIGVINRYIDEYPNKITLLELADNNHGSKNNFWTLSKYIIDNKQYDYFMYCDQDDVWLKNKVKNTLQTMLISEKDNPDKGILVHTDLKVVDEKLNILGDSFIKYRALDPSCVSPNRILIQNNVTGCTMMLNRKLLERALSVEKQEKIAMHDWWFALVASVFGKIVFLDEPTILYRQHGDNVVGATKVNSLGFIVKRLAGNNHIKHTLRIAVDQSQILIESYKDIPTMYQNVLNDYSKIYIKKNKIARIHTIIKYRIFKQGIVQNIGELMFI